MNQGQYVEYELVEEPISDNELQALLAVREAAVKWSKGELNEDEFKKRIEGPPQGIAGVAAQGLSAEDAAGAAATTGAEAQPEKNKWLGYSLSELKTELYHKKKDLERYKRDPEMPNNRKISKSC